MDINQQVLAVFQVEHKEQLEGIRAVLARMGQEPAGPQLDEAFRLAHSLKAGARVCDLHVVETLGHRLESLFSRLRQGRLRLDHDVQRVIALVLEAIEECAAPRSESQPSAEPTQALQAVERLLEPDPPVPRETARDIDRQVWEAFQQEHREYLEGIRALLAGMTEESPGGVDVDEIFRQAHSLKGAARVADLPTVANLAHRLESLLSQVREGKLPLSQDVRGTIHLLLNAVEDWMACLARGETPAEPLSALAASDRLLGQAESPSMPDASSPAASGQVSAPQPLETIRLTADSLDRLLRSSGQLLTEGLNQDQLARQLDQSAQQLDNWAKEWEALRKAAGARLHRLSTLPEFARVAHYLAYVEQQMRSLTRQMRKIRVMQRRSSWTLRLLGNQVQRDVRRARLVPAESVFQGFRKMMRDLAHDEGKEIDFRMSGLGVLADRLVLQALKDPLMHVLRNGAAHGIENAQERQRRGKDAVGHVSLLLEAVGNRLRIVVEDDGQGIDFRRVAAVAAQQGLVSETEASARSGDLLRLIFRPGFSTSRVVTELAGRGMGLSVVHETVTRLQGEVSLVPREECGTRVVLSVPLSVSTHRLLLVSCAGQTFALPLHGLECLMRLRFDKVESMEGRPILNLRGRPVPLLSLAQLLNLGDADLPGPSDFLQIAVLKSAGKRLAVTVDAFLAEREGLIKDLTGPAARVPRLAGAILLEDGTVSLVLNPAELVDGFKASPSSPGRGVKPVSPRAKGRDAAPAAPAILVVDDSFTTRTLEKSILETQGYRVRVAVDGVEALVQLRSEPVDLVIADVQMPHLDGFGLLETMKKDERLAAIPVIIVTSMDRREDQERGLALGAEAYIVKRKFDHEELLKTIRQIL